MKPNVLVQKLELFGQLPLADRKLLAEITSQKRNVPARTHIIREGMAPSHVFLVVDGLACRSKTLADGRRQIFAYLVPGDFCDLNVFILLAMDHDIETVSACQIVEIPRDKVLEMTQRPVLVRALWWATLVDEATLREWIVNVGQRSAEERIAHLFCELHCRMKSVGLAAQDSFDLPITQVELADTTGLSPVHVNRSLQTLRSRNLIEFKGQILNIPHVPKLQTFAGFHSNYLHLEGGK